MPVTVNQELVVDQLEVLLIGFVRAVDVGDGLFCRPGGEELLILFNGGAGFVSNRLRHTRGS